MKKKPKKAELYSQKEFYDKVTIYVSKNTKHIDVYRDGDHTPYEIILLPR